MLNKMTTSKFWNYWQQFVHIWA